MSEVELRNALKERILFLDGAMGTMVQTYKLTESDFRGQEFANHPSDLKGNNDLLCLTKPEIVKAIHRDYVLAGADIIETNTFNSTSISQKEYGLEAYVSRINKAAAELAVSVAQEE